MQRWQTPIFGWLGRLHPQIEVINILDPTLIRDINKLLHMSCTNPDCIVSGLHFVSILVTSSMKQYLQPSQIEQVIQLLQNGTFICAFTRRCLCFFFLLCHYELVQYILKSVYYEYWRYYQFPSYQNLVTSRELQVRLKWTFQKCNAHERIL